jgi:hypothetical protein
MLRRLLREIKASMGIYEPRPEDGYVYGVLAEYPDPGALMHAAEAVREAGYTHFDTFSPFPVHGMNRAMGLGNSKVGWFALGGGVTGLLAGFLLQWWTAAVDYPLNISGKPFFAVEPSVPIMFELTILFAAFGAVAGMLALNGLPRPYNPLFFSERFSKKASDDGFFLMIAASEDGFDMGDARDVLQAAGATHTEVIRDEDERETHEHDATAYEKISVEDTASGEEPSGEGRRPESSASGGRSGSERDDMEGGAAGASKEEAIGH